MSRGFWSGRAEGIIARSVTPNEARLAVKLFMYKVLFAMQCGQNCLLKKKRRDLDVILVDSCKISIHMSQAEREKYSVPGNFDRDWGRDNLICTHWKPLGTRLILHLFFALWRLKTTPLAQSTRRPSLLRVIRMFSLSPTQAIQIQSVKIPS